MGIVYFLLQGKEIYTSVGALYADVNEEMEKAMRMVMFRRLVGPLYQPWTKLLGTSVFLHPAKFL
jgi:hypothetical protein